MSFVPNLVPTERKRIECFYVGLHYVICVVLVDRTFATFVDVMRAGGEAKQSLATRLTETRNKDNSTLHPY